MNKVSPTPPHQANIPGHDGSVSRQVAAEGDGQNQPSNLVMEPEQAQAWVMYEFADGSFNVASLILIPKLIILMAEGSGVASSWFLLDLYDT